jgi:hypothetical protein
MKKALGVDIDLYMLKVLRQLYPMVRDERKERAIHPQARR